MISDFASCTFSILISILLQGGASSDLERATQVSTNMVKHLGMSEKIGLRIVQVTHVANFFEASL